MRLPSGLAVKIVLFIQISEKSFRTVKCNQILNTILEQIEPFYIYFIYVLGV